MWISSDRSVSSMLSDSFSDSFAAYDWVCQTGIFQHHEECHAKLTLSRTLDGVVD